MKLLVVTDPKNQTVMTVLLADFVRKHNIELVFIDSVDKIEKVITQPSVIGVVGYGAGNEEEIAETLNAVTAKVPNMLCYFIWTYEAPKIQHCISVQRLISSPKDVSITYYYALNRVLQR